MNLERSPIVKKPSSTSTSTSISCKIPQGRYASNLETGVKSENQLVFYVRHSVGQYFIARIERSERRASLILSRGRVHSKIIGVWIAVGTIRNVSALRSCVLLLFCTSLYAMESVSGKMVLHMREMFTGLDFGNFGLHSAPFGTIPVITLHKGRVKKCIEFLNIFFISFRRVTFVQLRTQAYFTADNVIISFAAVLKSDRVLVHVVSLATAKKELGWMLCLTLFIVFVCLRDRHFSHTKLLFEVTTDWREVRSKFLAKSLDIFGNASCLSQLKYS